MGRGEMSLGAVRLGRKRSHGICAPFPSFYPAGKKVRNGNFVSEDTRGERLIPKISRPSCPVEAVAKEERGEVNVENDLRETQGEKNSPVVRGRRGMVCCRVEINLGGG